VLGGTQSLHSNSRDEALGLPTEEAATLALRTQQILAHETGIPRIVDPLGGSYTVEALTDSVESEAKKLIEAIEKRGGVVKCIEEGWQQSLIHEAAYQYQREVESQERIVVGLNRFQEETKAAPPVLRIEPKIEAEQVGRLSAFKANRDLNKVKSQCLTLKKAAQEDRNLLPPIYEAVRDKVTLGEICQTLVEVYGRFKP